MITREFSCPHSRAAPRRVFVLLPDPETRARVRRALDAADVRFVRDGEEMLGQLALCASAAVMVAACDARGMTTAPLVRRIREAFPSTAILACCDDRSPSADLAALVRAGVDELVFRGRDDDRLVLPAVLVRAEQRCMATEVLEELRDVLPPAVRPIVMHLLEHAAEPPTVESTAAALGVHRKTLVNRLASAGLPAPRTLIAWARLLAAARLLEDSGRTVEQAAHLIGFDSPNALRNMLDRHTGLCPREVRENGGFRCVLRCFRTALERGRAKKPVDDATAHCVTSLPMA